MKRNRDRDLYICMTACLLTAAGALIYFIWRDGGALVLIDDFNLEQIPFLGAMNRDMKHFTGTWRWDADLGTQLIGAYSFYNLGSPFTWFTFLFPESSVPYLVGTVCIFKYTTAGITSYLYLRRFVQNRIYAAAGSLLYAFSGFQSTNLLFHFHDVTAFFPLLLLGLEIMMEERKRSPFIFAIFLNCLINYFFFVSEVIFLILYYLFRRWKTFSVPAFLKEAAGCVLAAAAGVGMACILFLPSILYIMGSPRSGASLHLYPLSYYVGYVLFAVKGFLFPAEAMNSLSCIVPYNYTSASCYLPMTGGSLAFAYMMKKKNDWLTRLLLFLWIVSCSSLLDSMFYLFAKPYKRWWFMFSLLLILASVKALDEKERYPVKKGILVNALLLISFFAGMICLDLAMGPGSVIFRRAVFAADVVIALAGLALTFFWLDGRKKMSGAKRLWGGIFLICLSFFCAATTFYTLGLYRQKGSGADAYLKRYQLGLQLENPDDQYRYHLSDNVLIFPGEAAGTGSFSSTISNSIHEFHMLFDLDWSAFTFETGSVPGVTELLAGKYEVTGKPAAEDKILDTVETDSVYYITEKDACPIGFVQTTYITTEELKNLPLHQRGIALLDHAVVDVEEQEQAEAFLYHSQDMNYDGTKEEILKLVERNRKNQTTEFMRDQSGFRCRASLKSKGMVFFSVPYDEGWTAYVNGRQTKILCCGGLMGILLPEGEYAVEFCYEIPGLKAGIVITCFSFAGAVAYALWERKKYAAPECIS